MIFAHELFLWGTRRVQDICVQNVIVCDIRVRDAHVPKFWKRDECVQDIRVRNVHLRDVRVRGFRMPDVFRGCSCAGCGLGQSV